MQVFNISVLLLSGLALFYASSMRLIAPLKANFLQTYLKNPENKLERDIDLMNETRGVGAVMLLGGVIALLGTIMPELRLTSLVVAAAIFGGVVLGRAVSVALDGRPSKDLIRSAIAEMVLGVLNMVCVISALS